MRNGILKVAGKSLRSRLIVGTGKYKNFLETAKAVQASGADMVTVAVRRVNILDKKKPILTDYLNPKKIIFLPNTAGCFNSEDALRTLRLAREMGGWKLVKLEVLGDKKTLYPNMIETIKSTKILVKEGFKVNPSKKPFFRKGKVGDWKEKLNKDQTQKIEKAFKAEMIELGYL